MIRPPLHVVIDCRKASDLGIGRYIRGVVQALRSLESRDRFTLLVDARGEALLPRDERFRHRIVSVGHYRLHEPFAIGRIIDAIGADVFHAPHYVYPSARTPGVVTIHDVIHLELPGIRNAPRRLYARAMIRRAVHRSREILTVSQASAGQIARRWPAAAAKITVTPNGVDERFFTIAPATGEPPLLLYAGNDKPHKNLDRLVEAWRRSERPVGARLVIAGSEPQRFLEVEGIELAGFVSEETLRDLYRRATALVLPSTQEGFGLPVLEAMAAGVPVTAAAIESIEEIAAGGAILFDPLDIDAIAASISRILRESDTREQLSSRGRERAREFRWESTAAATLEAYGRAARLRGQQQ